MIRDLIIFGINDKRLQEKLLREMELSLENAVKMCHASELARQHVQTFEEPAHRDVSQGEAVDTVTVKAKQWIKSKTKDDDVFSCKRYGEKHKPKRCPAYGKMCSKCNG